MTPKYRIREKNDRSYTRYTLEKKVLWFWWEIDWYADLGSAKNTLEKRLRKRTRPKTLVTYDRNGEVVNFDGEIRIEQFAG